MQKIAKLGLSAMVAFALMFTTTISVVAQEKVVASDKVEVKESVEAYVLANTLEKLKSNEGAKTSSYLDPVWFTYDGSGSFTDPTNYTQTTLGDGEIEGECPEGLDELCAIKVAPVTSSPISNPSPTALTAMEDEIEDTLDGTSPSDNVILKLGEN